MQLLLKRVDDFGYEWSHAFKAKIKSIVALADDMGFRCHWILRRLFDLLPNQSYRWASPPGAQARLERKRASFKGTLYAV
jgi:hypothetical protein